MTTKKVNRKCQNCIWGSPHSVMKCYVFLAAANSHTDKDRWVWKPIDKCIASIVNAFNAAGIYTTGSCCGHGERDGEILLLDGRKLIIRSRIWNKKKK